MRTIDRLFENSSRSLARHTSRRSVLATLGKLLTGAALIPLLPIDRSSRAQAADGNGTAPADARTPAQGKPKPPPPTRQPMTR
jgi:methylamine dehydrogenase light chain